MIQKILVHKKELVIAFLFFLLTSSIIFIWFREGYIYGGGDVGLPTYNPIRIVSMSEYPWWEAVAPGFLIPLAITAIPFEYVLSILQTLGFSNLLLQAVTFFLFFFLMGFGMYIFLLSLFKKNHFLSIIGALFYLFNPYMLIQVWHRFVHTSIFFAALLPYLAFFWRKWVKEGKIRYLLLFLLINLLGSYLFGTLAFIVSLWLFLFILTLLESTIPFVGRKLFLSQISRFIFGFVSWLLTNCWWLVPTLFIASSQYGQQYNQGANLVSFIEISKQAILPFSLQQVDPFNLYQQSDFGSIYSSLLFKVIPWVGVVVVLLGLMQALKRKQIAFFGISTVIIIFLAKGSSAPLGNLFIWGLRHFFFLGVIRNPSEKIGILLPFFYSILFIAGLSLIRDKLSKYLSSGYLNILMILILMPGIIFCWPIFEGKIFGSINSSVTVKVPESYAEVNKFIKNQLIAEGDQQPGCILHLPLAVSEALTYNWDAGYHGTDFNSLFFDSLPSISRSLDLPKFDDPLKGLAFTFMYPYSQNNDAILKALQEYNVKFIVLHKDADFLTDGIINPEEIEKVLDNLSFLRKVNVSGKLSVYELADKYFQSRVILSENPVYISSGENNNVWFFQAGEKKSSISESPDNHINKPINQYLSGETIFSDKSFRYYQAPSSSLLNNTFHNAVTEKLNSVMQQAKDGGNTVAYALIGQLLLGTQSIRDSFISNNLQVSSLSQYANTLDGLSQDQSLFPQLQIYIDNSILRLLFQEQIYTLAQIKSVNNGEEDVINKLTNKITQVAVKNYLFPASFNSQDIKVGTDWQVFNLSIPRSSIYEIYITKPFDESIFDNKLANIPFLIDGQRVILNSTVSGNTFSFGSKEMEEGVHEISYPTIYSKNLLVSENDWRISQGRINGTEVDLETSANTPSFVEVPFSGIEGGGLYHFNMDIKFGSGQSFYLQLVQDSDSLGQDKQPIMQINQYLRKQDIGEGWQNINFDSTLRMTTKNAKLRIYLNSDLSIFGSVSNLAIRNLSVQKILNNNIFVKSEDNLNIQGSDYSITKLVHKDPISYSGEINVIKPSFLILKETYNPGWVLTLKNDSSVEKPNDHLIGDLYGNAWFINKPGKYSFEIKFDSVKYNVFGFLISFISYLLLIFVFLFGIIRKNNG